MHIIDIFMDLAPKNRQVKRLDSLEITGVSSILKLLQACENIHTLTRQKRLSPPTFTPNRFFSSLYPRTTTTTKTPLKPHFDPLNPIPLYTPLYPFRFFRFAPPVSSRASIQPSSSGYNCTPLHSYHKKIGKHRTCLLDLILL